MSKDKEVVFFTNEFIKQIEYNQFLAKQLSDLHLYIMSNAFYAASNSMTLWFNPKDVEDIVYRHYLNNKEEIK